MSVVLTKTEIIGGSVDGTVRTFDMRMGRYVTKLHNKKKESGIFFFFLLARKRKSLTLSFCFDLESGRCRIT